MEKANITRGMFLLYVVLCLFLSGIISNGLAIQPSSFSVEDSFQHKEIITQDTSASSAADQFSSWNVGAFPIIFYSDETRLAGGAGVQLVNKAKFKIKSSSIGIIGFYTQNTQYVFQIAPNIYLKQGDYILSAGIVYSRYPDKFYGIGNHTSKEDEEDFTSRRFRIRPSIQKKIFSNLYVGVHYDFADEKLTKIEEGKLIDGRTISGSEGGSASGIGMMVTWDSRDDNLYPTHGSYHQFSATSYTSALGSDFIYNYYFLDLCHYRFMFNRHVLALQSIMSINTGNYPFQAMNQLGLFLRGYSQSRFVDKNLVVFHAEYRFPLPGRFGLVGFAGCGQVAHILEKISLKELKPSAGFGIRFAVIPAQKVNLRIDWGIGKDDSSFDISLMEFF